MALSETLSNGHSSGTGVESTERGLVERFIEGLPERDTVHVGMFRKEGSIVWIGNREIPVGEESVPALGFLRTVTTDADQSLLHLIIGRATGCLEVSSRDGNGSRKTTTTLIRAGKIIYRNSAEG